MRNKKRIAAWTGTTVAVVAASSLYVLGGSSAQALDSATLKSMLIPANQQIAGTQIGQEAVPVQDVAKSLKLDRVSYSPASCNNLAYSLHGVGNHTGWFQNGVRPGFSGINGGFSHTVVAIDGGVPLKLIREGAAACANGTVTFDGIVTGKIGFTEVTVPSAKGTTVVAYKESFSVPAATNAAQAKVLTEFGLPTEGLMCAPEVVYAVKGDLLFEIVEPTAALAAQSLQTLQARVPANVDTSTTVN